MPPEPRALAESLVFNPHWFADPPPWWVDGLNEEQKVAVATIQLQLIADTLAAQAKAVAGIQAAVRGARD